MCSVYARRRYFHAAGFAQLHCIRLLGPPPLAVIPPSDVRGHSGVWWVRPLEPDSFLFLKVYPAKLCDFDLGARMEGPEASSDMPIVGTPEFMSPELAAAIAAGDRHGVFDKLCDIWRYSIVDCPARVDG